MEKSIAFMQEMSNYDMKEVNGGSMGWIPAFGPVIVILVPQIFNEIIKE